MDNTVSQNNKRIAKNTIFLYFRMLVTIAIGFYTSRVVLQVLGVSDYGVFNVMGGIIGMLGYVNLLLAGGTSRFLTIALGEGNFEKLKLTFSTTFVLTIITALLVLLLGETIGLWFVNNYLNIELDRMDAANWVYQSVLFSSVLTIMQSPFTASILSHERMGIYAYMSILDAVLKLLIVYFLVVFDYDKLKLYAVLLFIIQTIDIVIYRVYCIRNFEECKPSFIFSKYYFREMFSYSAWGMVGSMSALLMTQGLNILINIFFGTIVNSARGIAAQVSNIVQQLYSNFQMAGRPQIMKYYASGEMENMYNLMCNNGKYCAFLLMCVIIPLFVHVKGLLDIWLVEVPEYTMWFVRWTLIYIFFRSIDEPLTTAIHAVGKLKIASMTTCVLNLLIFPISWAIYYYGGNPVWGAILTALFVPLCTICNFIMLKYFINFPFMLYVKRVIIPVITLLLLCMIIPVLFQIYVDDTIILTILKSLLSAISVCVIIFYAGLDRSTREKMLALAKNKQPFFKR